MFENATTLTILPGRLAEASALLRESILPLLRSQPGLLSLAFIPREAENQLTIVSIWQTEAHAQAIESDPRYREAFLRLHRLIQVQPVETPPN
jgi:heme-degrading monooxygenase HmoA